MASFASDVLPSAPVGTVKVIASMPSVERLALTASNHAGFRRQTFRSGSYSRKG